MRNAAHFHLLALMISTVQGSDMPVSSADDVRSKYGDWPPCIRRVEIESTADREKQAAMYYEPGSDDPHPLIVFLHPWGGNYLYTTGIEVAKGCIKNGWAFIQPDFRGPNNRPQAMGSDLAISDIADAIAYAKANGKIDLRRTYLSGASGGGHAALLAAGRLPGLFAAVSAWVPITDLVAWHEESENNGNAKYARDIEAACGGEPSPGTPAGNEAIRRSPLTHLSQAGPVWFDINTGIHDGHGKNSVPISHSMRAFNLLACPVDRIPETDIQAIIETESVDGPLRFTEIDKTYAPRMVLLRRTSGHARLTVTDGNHEILVPAMLAWLSAIDQEIRNAAPTESR